MSPLQAAVANFQGQAPVTGSSHHTHRQYEAIRLSPPISQDRTGAVAKSRHCLSSRFDADQQERETIDAENNEQYVERSIAQALEARAQQREVASEARAVRSSSQDPNQDKWDRQSRLRTRLQELTDAESALAATRREIREMNNSE